MTREKTSFQIAGKWTKNIVAYHDFSHSIFNSINSIKSDKQTILVNLNMQSNTLAHIHQIKSFVQKFPGAEIIYFPCDMNDDALLYLQIKH